MTNPSRVGKSEVGATSQVLSRAFHDDPLFTFFIPDARRRQNKLHHVMNTVVRYSVSWGEVYTTSPNFEGVSVWLPSHKVEMNFWRGLRSGGLSIILHLGLAATFKQLSVSDLMCSVHKRLISSPHWYLYLLGVEPPLQGKGHASNVMKVMLNRADQEGFACYLDNSNEKNLSMYQHYGFKVVEEYQVLESDVRLWAMLREPR